MCMKHCRHIIITKNDVIRRYNEDLEAAAESGFQGPIHKSLHAYEIILGITGICFMASSIILLMWNWVFTDTMQFLPLRYTVSIPGPGLCGITNCLHENKMPSTNLSAYPSDCTFSFVVNNTQVYNAINEFSLTEMGMYMKPLPEHKFAFPQSLTHIPGTSFVNETIACFKYNDPPFLADKIFVNTIIVFSISALGLFIMFFEVTNNFAPSGHALHTFENNIKGEFKLVGNWCFYFLSCRFCCFCPKKITKTKATRFLRGYEHHPMTRGASSKELYFGEMLLYESPLLSEEYDTLNAFNANLNIPLGTTVRQAEEAQLWHNFKCKFCHNTARAKVIFSPLKEINISNLNIPLPEDGRFLKVYMLFNNGFRTTHMTSDDFEIKLLFKRTEVIQKNVGEKENEENDNMMTKFKRSTGDIYESFLQYMLTTIVFNVLISLITTPGINLLGNDAEMHGSYNVDLVYTGPGLWMSSGGAAILPIFFNTFLPLLIIFYCNLRRYDARTKKTTRFKSVNDMVTQVMIRVSLGMLMGLATIILAVKIVEYIDAAINNIQRLNVDEILFGVSLNWRTFMFKVPPIQVPIAILTFSCGAIRLNLLVIKSIRKLSSSMCRKKRAHTLKSIAPVEAEEEVDGTSISVNEQVKEEGLNATKDAAVEKTKEITIQHLDDKFKPENVDGISTAAKITNAKICLLNSKFQNVDCEAGASISHNSMQPSLCTGTYGEVGNIIFDKKMFKGNGWSISGLKMRYKYVSSKETDLIPMSPMLSRETFFRIIAQFSYATKDNRENNDLVDLNHDSESI